MSTLKQAFDARYAGQPASAKTAEEAQAEAIIAKLAEAVNQLTPAERKQALAEWDAKQAEEAEKQAAEQVLTEQHALGQVAGMGFLDYLSAQGVNLPKLAQDLQTVLNRK